MSRTARTPSNRRIHPIEVACGRDRKARAIIVAQDAGHDDAESRGGTQVFGRDAGRPGSVLSPTAENHIGGVVRVPTYGPARCADNDVGKAITIDIASVVD